MNQNQAANYPCDYLSRLRGVHPVLSACLIAASVRFWGHRQPVDGSFVRFTEGLRTQSRHSRLIAEGKSWTEHSYHLTGKAVDVALFPNGRLSWDFEYYRDFNEEVQEVAGLLGTLITWGGEWAQRDGVHFQIETHVKM